MLKFKLFANHTNSPSQVRKDVLRTDRSDPFYVSKVNMDTEQQNDITSSVSTYSSILTQFDGRTNESSLTSSYAAPSDYCSTHAQIGIDQQVGVYENRNMQALTNVLTTYALNHQIGYWPSRTRRTPTFASRR